MISILLTAGTDTKKLASYIEQQKAIEVQHQYESLGQSHMDIVNNLIDVDKLVYVLKEGMTFRDDLGALKRNLESNTFFTVREILFICCDSYDNSEPLKFFNGVMQATGFERFKIISVQDLSFAEIYQVIIGTKDSNKFVPNKKVTIYRREKNSLGNTAYVEDDEVLSEKDFFTVITPDSTEDIENNIRLKSIIAQGDNGNIIEDNREDVGTKLDNVVLPSITLPKEKNRNIVLITGGPKTGVSVMNHLISNSALDGGVIPLMVDATNTGSSKYLAKKFYNFINDIDFKTLVTTSQATLSSGCNILSIDNTTDIGILDRINYLINNEHKLIYDVLLIECNLNLLKPISNLVMDKLHSILYCCDMNEVAVKDMSKQILNIPSVKTTVLLSNNIQKYEATVGTDVNEVFQDGSITGSEIKEIFKKAGIKCKIIKIPRVTSIENDFYVYESIIGIRR